MVVFQSWIGLVPPLLIIVDAIIRVVALFVVPKNRTPSSGMAWLLFIFFLPIPGLAAYLLIGTSKMPNVRQQKLDRIIALMQAEAEIDARTFGGDPEDIPAEFRNAEKLALDLGAQPRMAGNHATITHNYEESIAVVAEAIKEANEFVNIEFYILSYDETTQDVFKAIREVTGRGVKVRVLLDHIATLQQPKHSKTIKKLEEVGAEWAYMLPVRPWRGQWRRPDLRNHRKIVVVDGKVGFIGSQNMVDTTYNKRSNLRRGLKWRDIMVRVTGPVVSNLNRVFMGDWYLETGETLEDSPPRFAERLEGVDGLACQILPSGPGFGEENNLQVFIALMGTATQRISITSPYFVPDQAIMYAIKAATARGVEVELFVSETGDQPMVYHAQRSYYEDLLRAGVRIFMFKPPYILHSKHFTIDDAVAVVGSSNMDQRSFNLNMEVSMIVHGKSFVDQLDEVNAYYHENSRELTLDEWEKQPLWSQFKDGIYRLTSSLQ